MADLCTVEQYKAWAGITDGADDQVIDWACGAASAMIRGWCGRSFHIETNQSATARYFHPLSNVLCMIDDAHTVTTVETDDADSGAWGTSWTVTTDYILEPYSGVGPTGLTGWPYTKIVAVGSRTFPYVGRPAVKVTAKWGWSTLPDDVFTAQLMLVTEVTKSKSGGYEVFAADAQFQPIRRNVVIRDMLQPYRTSRANDARFVVG